MPALQICAQYIAIYTGLEKKKKMTYVSMYLARETRISMTHKPPKQNFMIINL